MTEAQQINALFAGVKKVGYIKTAEAVNASVQYFELSNNTIQKQQLLSAWNWVLRSRV